VNVIAFFLVLTIVFKDWSLTSVPFERALDVLKACVWITEQLMPLWLLRIDYSKARTENNNSAPNHQITPDSAFVAKYGTKMSKNRTHMSSESSKLITRNATEVLHCNPTITCLLASCTFRIKSDAAPANNPKT